MGGLLIKNQELRCQTCFILYRLKIKTMFPTCKLVRTCNCSTDEIEIPKFLIEYKKNKTLTISCSKCNKTNPKDPKYCQDCKQLFCINCCKSFHTEENNNNNHNIIVIEKYDFFCITHQNENFSAFCNNCKINVCAKCGQEKLHEGHKVLIYNKIYDEKKMKEYIKKAIKSAELKMEYNKKICQMMCKEVKKKDLVKDLKALEEINENENKRIIEVINILSDIYDKCKQKNYSIIRNLIDNINFNFERIKFEKDTTKEKDAELLYNYYKTNFIIEGCDGKSKEEVPPQPSEEPIINDQEKDDNADNEKENAPVENEKKEEKGPMTALQEKSEMLKNKLSGKIGFQPPDPHFSSSNSKSIDIVHVSQETPDDVMNIINSQTINKKVKKKPKKVNMTNFE